MCAAHRVRCRGLTDQREWSRELRDLMANSTKSLGAGFVMMPTPLLENPSFSPEEKVSGSPEGTPA